MRSLRRAGLALALGGLLAANAAPTFAADNGTVDAQVTVATPCITITQPSLDFGTLPFSSATTTGTSQRNVNYQNCGDADERIWAAGTNAQGGLATWTLDDLGNTPLCDRPVNSYRVWLGGPILVNLSLVPAEIQQLAAAGSTQVPVALYMPCVGSDGVGATMSFQILFTATF